MDPIKGPDTTEGDTLLLDPGHLEGQGSLWKLPQFERKPGRDPMLPRDETPPDTYPDDLKSIGLSPKTNILGEV